jgi:hypothetical protein
VKLQLKFKESASDDARKMVLGKLSSRGVRKVEPLFPDSHDGYLKSLYTVDAGEDRDKLLELLQAEDAVEVAEPEARRRLAAY